MKKLLAVIMAIAMVLSFVACAKTETATTAESSASGAASTDEVVVINYPTFQVGVNTSAKLVERLVSEFNEKYAGKYQIVVEEVPGDANYLEKIQVMLASGELPSVVYPCTSFMDLALAQDALTDITAYVEADPEWKAQYTDSVLEVNSRDGKIYGSSQEDSMIGYYYNKELFAKAGIEKPAETWEEFFEICDKLVEAGITPIALDTGDGAWCSQLLWGAMIAAQGDEGKAFLRNSYNEDWSQECVVKAAEMLQKCFQNYTTADAVGGKYENAANNFFSENVAMICNGCWMIGDFSDTSKVAEGFADKVGVAAYPGNMLYDSPIEGYLIAKTDDKKLEEACVEMVKFFTSDYAQGCAVEMQGMLPTSPNASISDEAKENYPLLVSLIDANKTAYNIGATLFNNAYPGIEDTMVTELPNLASGALTAQQFCDKFTEVAKAAAN